MNFFRDLFFQLLEQFNRHVVIGHVDFTAAIAVNVSHFRRNWQVGHLVNNGFGVVPVVGITLKHNALVNHPVLQFIRTVSDNVGGLSPLIAVFFNGGFRNRRNGRVHEQFVEIRNRFAQGDFKSMIINRFHTEIGDRLFTGDNVINIDDMTVLQITGVR